MYSRTDFTDYTDLFLYNYFLLISLLFVISILENTFSSYLLKYKSLFVTKLSFRPISI